MAGRTTLLVAHRRSTLHLADRIVVLDDGRVVEQGTHDELMARSALYRALLSGWTRSEAAAGRRPHRGAAPRCRGRSDGDDRLGLDRAPTGARGPAAVPVRAAVGAPSIGPGLGRWRRRWLAAQPGADARAAGAGGGAAPGARRRRRSTSTESRATTAASACRVCCAGSAGRCWSGWCWSSSTRWPTLAGPGAGEDRHRQRRVDGLRGRALRRLGRLPRRDPGRPGRRDRRDVRHRAGGAADHAVAADPHLGPAAAALARLLRARDGRADHDPDDDRRRPVRVADRERAALGAGLDRHLRRRRRRAGGDQHRTRAVHARPSWSRSPSPPSIFRRRRPRGSTTCPASASRSSTPTSRRACRGCASRRPSSTRRATDGAASTGSGATISTRASRPSGWWRPTSRSCSSCPAVADAIVLGVGAGLIASGDLTAGALIAFILYIDMFFSPIQQLSQVFDSWQQTRVSVGRIAELMQLETLTPEAGGPCRTGPTRGASSPSTTSASAYPVGRRQRRPTEATRRAPRAGRRPAARVARRDLDASRPRRCAASICASRRARPWRWSARPAPASRR